MRPTSVAISIHSPHTGRDAHILYILIISINFNPLSPHGERRWYNGPEGPKISFQSTLPTRGETVSPCWMPPLITISIHSPHTGRDRRHIHRDGGPRKFQSPLPTRGETTACTRARRSKRFQSTLPTRGETRLVNGQRQYTGISIHSPHTGRDALRGLSLLESAAFQSTLPTRGETGADASIHAALTISIHSPHTGRDPGGKSHLRPCGISIHSPHTGRDVQPRGATATRQISIHSPHTGRDEIWHSLSSLVLDFNPLSPHGERPVQSMSFPSFGHISIHSPHTGRDDDRPANLSRKRRFQSTLPTRGETGGIGIFSAPFKDISIHSPHTGRDPLYSTALAIGRFQSTLPTRGETAARCNNHAAASEFQSTLPTRGETAYDYVFDGDSYISIHSPHTGRDSKRIQPFCTKSCCICTT